MTLGDRFAEFKAMEGADKRRVISGALINNAMYIIIAIAVIFIAIKVPAFCQATVHHQHHFADRSEAPDRARHRRCHRPHRYGYFGGAMRRSDRLHRGIAAAGGQLLRTRCSRTSASCRCGSCFLIVVAVGALVGLVNGFFVAKFKLHPFIVTLSTQLIVFGSVLMYLMIGTNNGQTLSGLDASYTEFVRGTLFTDRRCCRTEVCALCRDPHGADVGHLEQDHLRQEHVRCRLQ